MIERFKRKYLIATVAAAFAALGVGGAAMAQSNPSSAPPQKADTPAAQVSEAPGQESNAPENSATDPDNIQDTSSKDTTEARGQESNETPGQESSSEVANDDGPGGHADEPGNPNADHQFQGVE
jgi:hypothetical protein